MHQPGGATDAAENGQTQVLIVDDEPAIRAFLEIALSNAGYGTVTAGEAGEALAQADQPNLRVAIVDINLPGLSGLELCRRLTAEFELEVIVITGDDDTYDYETAAGYGAVDFLIKPIGLRELVLRIERALNHRRLGQERDTLVEQLRRLSITDDLTGLYNARHFFNQLRAEVQRTGRYGKAFSLLILDVDYFKRVNDRYGHLQGDEVLRQVAGIIRHTIRDVDTAYRYGGEEMAVILPETGSESVRKVAERLLENARFNASADGEAEPLPISVSIGIAHTEPGEPPESVVDRADRAMYAAKAAGRDCIRLAPPYEGDSPAAGERTERAARPGVNR